MVVISELTYKTLAAVNGLYLTPEPNDLLFDAIRREAVALIPLKVSSVRPWCKSYMLALGYTSQGLSGKFYVNANSLPEVRIFSDYI